MTVENENGNPERTRKRLSRRDFLKYGAGAAAVAAGATQLLGKISPLTSPATVASPIFQAAPAASIEEINVAQIESQLAAGTPPQPHSSTCMRPASPPSTRVAPGSTRASNSTPTRSRSPANWTRNVLRVEPTDHSPASPSS